MRRHRSWGTPDTICDRRCVGARRCPWTRRESHEPGRRHRADPCCRRLAYAGVTGDDPQSRSKLSQTNWNVLSFVSLISIWADLRQCGFCCWSHSEDEPKGSKAQRLLSRFSAASAKRMARANAKDTPIQLLFHYTNEEALYSIIKSESFWFTSIYFMDDDAELSFGFGIAHDLPIRRLIVDPPPRHE